MRIILFQTMGKYLLISFIALAFCSCKTQELFINIVEPAPVTMPPYIRKVGIINRSLPSEETKKLDAIDKAITLEGANLDREGGAAAIKGLSDELLANDRFTEIKQITSVDFRTTGLGVFPVPLAWEVVDMVCSENGTDALFALELFDTDTKINYAAGEGAVSTPFGKLPTLAQRADIVTLVKTGWRIYDPRGRNLLDEYQMNREVVFSARGINPVAAAAGIIDRKDAVKDAGFKTGQAYSLRLLPHEFRVVRDYFVQGTNNFKIAKRKAQTGNWNEAGDLWNKETGNSKGKIAGRACYNMAIINEINGDLDQAIAWAQKAYEDYKTRLALKYVRILENRKISRNILEEQEKR
jgi:hypothetical protein